MKEREKVNKELIEEIEAFCFHNKMTIKEFAEFFGFREHKPRNWKNSPRGANPTVIDLRQIAAVQRSAKGDSLKYRFNTTKISTGFEKTLEEERLLRENTIQKEVIESQELKIYKLQNK